MPNKTAEARHRNTKIGRVVSCSGRKTIVVEVVRQVQHPLYKRYVNRSKKFYAHDAKDQCHVGDWVRLSETRPLSRLKRWRLEEIIQRAPVAVPAEASVEPVAAGK